jgi:hypothetical protein
MTTTTSKTRLTLVDDLWVLFIAKKLRMKKPILLSKTSAGFM